MEVLFFFIKIFQNLNQQIEILHHRGLHFDSPKQAKQFLLRNNYYNIINGYSKYFQQSTNIYLPNAKFEEIASTYFYDKQIKQYTLRAILETENHIKYTTTYYFAKNYPNKKYAYLDINCYDQNKCVKAIKTISKFSDKINYFSHPRQTDNPIKHYIRTHEDVPIWVIIEYLTFGELTFFVENLPDKIKTQISKSSKRRNFYNSFIILQCFISDTQYGIIHNSMLEALNNLERKISSINSNILLEEYGFPKDWNSITNKIKQQKKR